jgi:integrin alpha FG-GAP repeat containing protein 1
VRRGVEPLAGIADARGAVFVDLDEDGTLDVMVQRTGDQGAGRVLFVQNNFYYDAFFMKAIRAAIFLLFSVPSNNFFGYSAERRV